MKISNALLGVALAGFAALASAQDAAAGSTDSWPMHLEQMRKYHQSWQQATTPEDRQKFMQEHWSSMQSGAGMMGCPLMGGGMGGMGAMGGMPHGGMGGMPGGMQAAPTREALDARIQQMEQMLEHLRAHRQMLESTPQ